MHQPYHIILGHQADFKVRYRFFTKNKGGRATLPYQGYRSDFWYLHEEQESPNSIYMIRPEFLDNTGEVITDSEVTIPREGIAKMWIIVPGMREFHRKGIKIGVKGFFMEGPNRVAEAEVIEIMDLHTNPIAH